MVPFDNGASWWEVSVFNVFVRKKKKAKTNEKSFTLLFFSVRLLILRTSVIPQLCFENIVTFWIFLSRNVMDYILK